MIKMKDIPVDNRPRERLIRGESEQLSNDELLAIILRSGTKENSAKDLANILLKEVGKIEALATISYNQLIKIKGIKSAKACSLLATIELGKRIARKNDYLVDTKFKNSKIIYDYYKNKLGDKLQEYFYCLYLDNNKRIIKEKLLFIGTLNQSLVHPREVFKEACVISAHSIICIHNHPTGNVLPSRNDIEITKKLFECGKMLGISLIDHIIIGYNNYYSFFENNQI